MDEPKEGSRLRTLVSAIAVVVLTLIGAYMIYYLYRS